MVSFLLFSVVMGGRSWAAEPAAGSARSVGVRVEAVEGGDPVEQAGGSPGRLDLEDLAPGA